MKDFAPILLFLLLFTTCDKRIFDFRNEYAGEYIFSGYDIVWSANEEHGDTTYFNDVIGELSYSREDDKEIMNIQLNGEFSYDMIINKSGDFSLCGGEGKIDSDLNLSVSFDKFVCDYGKASLGGKNIYTFTGSKK